MVRQHQTGFHLPRMILGVGENLVVAILKNAKPIAHEQLCGCLPGQFS